MASRPRPLRFLALWVIVPAALYGVGYYLVGPQIGSRVPETIKQMAGDRFTMLNKQVRRIVAPAARPASSEQAPPSAPQPEAVSAPPPDAGGPQVEVSVRSATPTHHTYRTGGIRPKRRLHRKPKPKPKPETTDQGSYGGTQDQGVTTGRTVDPPTGG